MFSLFDSCLKSLWAFLRAVFGNARQLALENLALRQQLAIYESKRKKPKLRRCDRIFWVWLSRLWDRWSSALLVVKPETVIGWHRQGFQLYTHGPPSVGFFL
jgi:putative transposase